MEKHIHMVDAVVDAYMERLILVIESGDAFKLTNEFGIQTQQHDDLILKYESVLLGLKIAKIIMKRA